MVSRDRCRQRYSPFRLFDQLVFLMRRLYGRVPEHGDLVSTMLETVIPHRPISYTHIIS